MADTCCCLLDGLLAANVIVCLLDVTSSASGGSCSGLAWPGAEPPGCQLRLGAAHMPPALNTSCLPTIRPCLPACPPCRVVEAVGVDHDDDCPPGCSQRHAFHYVRVRAARSTAPPARRSGRRLDLVVDLQQGLRCVRCIA
jgi:hypothetical protein